MLNFILKRLVYGLFVLFGVVIVVFFLFQMTRINPERQIAGEKADKQTIENIKKELGLDLPVGKQLLLYLNDISPFSIHNSDPDSRYYLNADKYAYSKILTLGTTSLVIKKPYLSRSYVSKRSVSEILSERIPNTLILAFTAMILATFFGIIFGVAAAVQPNSFIDRLCTAGSVLGISFPSFFVGIILQLVFAYLLVGITGLNMTGDLYVTDGYTGEKFLELKNLILPAIALGIRPVAVITQLTRSAMIDVLNNDYIRTARAKGLSKNVVLFRHALKNALNPVVTSISGWLAGLLTGAFFIEAIFNYNGIGYETVNALKTFDYPVAMGAILYTAVIFVGISILVDILYSVIDPRIRIS
ncbi:MAG: ABC transporter permease [Chitinophagales bacterium]